MKLRHRIPVAAIRAYEFLVRGMIMLPYFRFSFKKDELVNLRSAFNTIGLCNSLGIVPDTLVDVGAANSQWAIWLKKSFSKMRVISFEPLMAFSPIGELHRYALGEHASSGMMIYDGKSSRISPEGTEPVSIMRFDQLDIDISGTCVLKVDAENYTAAALKGFGKHLSRFSLVVVEMWNDYQFPEFINQQATIWKTMLDAGFTYSKMVDAEYAAWTFPCYDMAFYKK